MGIAIGPDIGVEVLKIPVVPVNQMAIQFAAFLAKRYEVIRIEFELRMKVKGLAMMHLQPVLAPAPLAGRFFLKMLFLNPGPFRGTQVCRLALDDVGH